MRKITTTAASSRSSLSRRRARERRPLGTGAFPDLIVHDAVVLTLDPDLPTATALAVTGDRFVAVGSDEDVLGLAGPSTTLIDLDGKAVTPGFIDSHSHWIGDRDYYGVRWARKAIQMALEGGWTSINEHFVNQERLDELTRLDAADELRLRVNAYLPVNYGRDQRFGMWFSDHTPGEVIGPRLRLAGVKFFVDACSPNTMYMTQGRRNDPKDFGNFHWRRNELRRMVRRVHEAGWQIAAHSCGDAATDEIPRRAGTRVRRGGRESVPGPTRACDRAPRRPTQASAHGWASRPRSR